MALTIFSFLLVLTIVMLTSQKLLYTSQPYDDFIRARQNLVSQIDKLKFGDLIFTENELKADEIFKNLRSEFVKSGNFLEDFYYLNIIKYKQIIQNSELFKTLYKMPKGGVLHQHLLTEIDPLWLKSKLYSPNIYEYDMKLRGNIYKMLVYTLVPQAHYRDLQKMRYNFTVVNKLGNNADFDNLIASQISLNETEILKGQNNDEMWAFAMPKYFYAKNLVQNAVFLKEHLVLLGKKYGKEGIYRLETRFTPGKTMNNYQKIIPVAEEMQIFEDAISEIRREYPYFSIGIIFEIIRNQNDTQIYNLMKMAYDLKQKYPTLICGIDFDGDENNFRRFYNLSQIILSTQAEMQKSYRFNLPLIIHCGESIIQANENPIDGFLLKPIRVGHGINFIKFPILLSKLIQENILVEVNLISNQQLKHVRDIRNHPAITFFNYGIPICISGDDPTLYGSGGITYDVFGAVIGFEWGIKELKKVMKNSILYMSYENKQDLVEIWEKDWNRFIENIIKNSNYQ